MRRLISLCLAGTALIAAAGACAQVAGDELPPPAVSFVDHTQSIDFKLFRGNRIVVPATVAGHATEVILDSGASATTLDRKFARSIGLPEGQKIDGLGAGGPVQAELLTGVTVEVGGMTLKNMSVAVIDLGPIERSIGRPIHAILGREFFNSAVVSIDWTNSKIKVSAPQHFTAPAQAAAVPLQRKGPFHTIPVSIDAGPTVQALLDIGNGGSLSLPPDYWRSRANLAQLPFAESQLGGVGGLHSARLVSMPKVTLAGQTFDRVPTVLSDTGSSDEPAQMTNVGIGLLKQFRVDLDLGHDRIYLAPRNDAPAFEHERTGIRFERSDAGLRVAFLSPQGPGAAAGLKVGDMIVAVDGQKVDANYYDRPDWTRSAAGRQVSLERADGSRVTVTLRDYY
jgi:hypothetical protein